MSELDELVAELRAALKAADNGPWFLLQGDDTACHNCGQEHVYYRWDHEYGEAGSILSTWPVEVMGCTDWNIANAHLIANAPTWLTAILDGYEAERDKVREYAEAVIEFCDSFPEQEGEDILESRTRWAKGVAKLAALAATPPDGVSARREVERLKTLLGEAVNKIPHALEVEDGAPRCLSCQIVRELFPQ